MRILFIHAAREGLSAEYKVHAALAQHAAAHGVEAVYLWQGARSGPVDVRSGQVFYQDFGRDLSLRPRPSRPQRAAMMLRRLPEGLVRVATVARRVQPDLIYTSQQLIDMELARFAQRFVRVPHVVHLHYNIAPWMGRYALNVMRSIPKLLAVSEFVRQTAILQGISAEAVHTLPNTISAEPISASSEQARGALRKEFGWAADCQVIISVGRLDPEKGHRPLIEAFSEVVRTVQNARLLICGESTSRNGYDRVLKSRVSELGLEHRVVFAGQRKDVSTLMHGADVFCLPTELEPFGLVFLEAMSAGLPVVAFLSGGVPEIVIHERTGLLSYPGDESALRDNLLTVLINRDLAKALGHAGRERVTAEFGAERIAKNWVNWLANALGTGPAPVPKSVPASA